MRTDPLASPTELYRGRLRLPQALRQYDEIDLRAEYRRGQQDTAFVILALAAVLLFAVLAATARGLS